MEQEDGPFGSVERRGDTVFLILSMGAESEVRAPLNAMGAAKLGHMLLQASADAKRYERRGYREER